MRKIGELPLRQVMRKIRPVHPETPLPEVIAELERDQQVTSLPVVDSKGEFIGDIYERDLLKLVIDPMEIPLEELTGIFGRMVDLEYFAQKAKDIMNRRQITMKPDEKVKDAVRIMFHHNLDTIPIVEKGKVIGVVTELSILEKVYAQNRKKKK